MNKVTKLEQAITKHKALYYSGKPEISDVEYDALEEELRAIDPENPALFLVGHNVKSVNKVKHSKKMLSLNKTYIPEDLLKWVGDKEVVSTFKVDGVSCSIIYKNGVLDIAKTRGDGTFGENITQKVKWINNIPKRLSQNIDCEIRGELYCDDKYFFDLVKKMQEIGLEKPSSQRNIVAGLIGRKDHIYLCEYISFFGFDIITNDIELSTEIDKKNLLEKFYFNIPRITLHKNNKKINKEIEYAQEFINSGDYQIDGIVFSYNELKLHDELGETAHHPRYKMAFKFKGEAKETIINDIIWSVSRNGILTPVAIIEPTELSGAMISRVTLHNYGVVEEYKLKIGDRIKVIRSGEVIPKFLEVIESKAKGYKLPKKCPSCNNDVVIEDIRIFCRYADCPAQNLEQILNFIKKIGVDDLSSKRVEEMLNIGLISNISDIYKLTVEQLLTMDKVKDKLANKIINNIHKTKKTNIVQFLASLGITGGAINKCEKVVNAGFNTIDKLMTMTIEQLAEVEGFAKKSSYEFVTSLQSKQKLIHELIDVGFKFEKIEEQSSNSLTGNKYCITGTLSLPRKEVEKLIKSAGGEVVSSVSSKTNYLVTNDTESTSSKFKKATELGIPKITDIELRGIIEGKKE